MTIGENIRELRKQKKLTQKQLGGLCNIAEPTIRRYELGKLNPKLETIGKIALALGCSASDLIESEYWKTIEMTSSFAPVVEGGNKMVHTKLVQAYDKLNPNGQEKALEYVEDLSKIPDYSK